MCLLSAEEHDLVQAVFLAHLLDEEFYLPISLRILLVIALLTHLLRALFALNDIASALLLSICCLLEVILLIWFEAAVFILTLAAVVVIIALADGWLVLGCGQVDLLLIALRATFATGHLDVLVLWSELIGIVLLLFVCIGHVVVLLLLVLFNLLHHFIRWLIQFELLLSQVIILLPYLIAEILWATWFLKLLRCLVVLWRESQVVGGILIHSSAILFILILFLDISSHQPTHQRMLLCLAPRRQLILTVLTRRKQLRGWYVTLIQIIALHTLHGCLIGIFNIVLIQIVSGLVCHVEGVIFHRGEDLLSRILACNICLIVNSKCASVWPVVVLVVFSIRSRDGGLKPLI